MKKRLIVTTIMAILFLLPIVFAAEYTPTLNYNASEVNYTNDSVSILQQSNLTYYNITVQREFSLIAAMLYGDNNNRLDKYQYLDSNTKNLDNDEGLNLTFNGTLKNKDLISFKLENNKAANVHICEPSVDCSFPGYGSVVTSTQGFYQITLNITNQTNNLSFHTNNKFDLNHINATHFQNETLNSTSYYYLSSTEMTTEEIEPVNLSSWNNLIINETLNSQTIEYFYSIDSGLNWSNLSSTNLSSINSSKLTLRVILTSNGSETPYLYTLLVNYTVIIPSNFTNTTTNTTNTTSNTTTSSTSGDSSQGLNQRERQQRFGNPALNLPNLPPVRAQPFTPDTRPPTIGRPQTRTVSTPQQNAPSPRTAQGPTGAVSATNSDSGFNPSSAIAIGIMLIIGAGITIYSVKIRNIKKKLKRRKNHIISALEDIVNLKKRFKKR